MRFLVTGSEGFIGSHLCPELASAGHFVARADLKREPLLEDCRRAANVARLLDQHAPDVVVHLAARVGRLFGEDDVAETIADNAGMTATVASLAGQRGIRVAYASTSEVYGDQAETEVDEEEGPFAIPHNVYGLSKRWGEDACRLYAPDGLAILRLSMPYGPGHPPGFGRAALTNFLWNAKQGAEIAVHRGSERSWCWIGDTVRAARLALEQPHGGVWNVGRDDNTTTMREVAELACGLVGASFDLIREVDPPGRQTIVKRLSTERVRQLGWRPEVDLEEGMRLTLEWLERRFV